MPRSHILLVPLLLAVSGASALAGGGAPAAPGDGQGRYALAPVDGGVMRLDKETGAMTLCVRRGEQWSCDPLAGNETAANGRLKALEEENARLKTQIQALEAAKGSEAPAEPGAQSGPPPGTAPLPSEEEVDKAFDYVERMFKKLKERIQKFDQPGGGSQPQAEPPAGGGQL